MLLFLNKIYYIRIMNLSRKGLVALIELPATEFGLINHPLVSDIYSRRGLRAPPRAIPGLAAILMQNGWVNVHQVASLYSEGKLTERDNFLISNADLFLASALDRTAQQTNEVADIHRQRNPNGIRGAGGLFYSYNIENALNHFDFVVINEGEATALEVAERYTKDRDLAGIPGIAYKKGSEIIINPPRRFLTQKELGELPLPYYDELTKAGMKVGTVSNERGCPHDCTFCLVTKTFGGTIRHFPTERVLKEIEMLKALGIKSIFINGDNSAGNPIKSRELFEAIAERNYGINFIAQVDINAASKPKLLEAMRKAGVSTLCIGYESGSDAVLKYVNKHATAKKNKEAARVFKDYGFWQHAMLIMGLDPETPETFRETIEWAKRSVDSVQFFVPTPFRGTPIYTQLESEKRIISNKNYLYDGQNVVILPVNFSPYELQLKVFEAYNDFYSLRSAISRLGRSPERLGTLGILAYTQLGGIDAFVKNPQTKAHLEFLKSIS